MQLLVDIRSDGVITFTDSFQTTFNVASGLLSAEVKRDLGNIYVL